MQHIETIELGSSQASITFSSIPQDYDDLVLKISARSNRGATFDELQISFNGVTTNRSQVTLDGSGSATESFSTSDGQVAYISAASTTANTFANCSIYISNYSASQANSISTDAVMENNATLAFQVISAMLWNDTSAITSVVLDMDFDDFVSGSVFSLYGVTAGGDGTVTTS